MSKKKRGVVFDFDGALTPKHIGALYKVVDENALPKKAEALMIALREKYLPKINDGTITLIDELYWLTETFAIYEQVGLTRESWEQALDDVRLRPGVQECLVALHWEGVAVGIVSYGCADFIEYVLRKHGVSQYVDSVLAARLRHTIHGRVVGYDRTTLVYPDNKDVWSRRFADAHGITEDGHLLAVGDSAGDRKLGIPHSPKLGIAESEEQLKKLKPYFSDVLVLPDDATTFKPVLSWLRQNRKG